jgi:hypothetical protein
MIWFYDHIRMSKTLLNLLSVSYDFPTVPAFSQKWNIASEKNPRRLLENNDGEQNYDQAFQI